MKSTNLKNKTLVVLLGPTGVGKTEICYQIADELSELIGEKFHVIMVKAPVLSRDDFIIPFPVLDKDRASFKILNMFG